jgi:hypothetical protein
MNNPDMYYQESGNVDLKGILIVAVVGAVTAALLGAIYGYVSYYIPLIYFNFFITLFFGIGVGFALGKASLWGSIRNTKFMLAAGLFFGVLAIYFGWVSWFHAVSEQSLLMFGPGEILQSMEGIASFGAWSIFGWTPTGTALYIIWAIEAIMVIGGTTLLAMGGGGREPYCEDCDAWTASEVLPGHFSAIEDPIALISGLESRDMSLLTKLEKVEPTELHRTKVELVKCGTCRNSHYLTVEHVEASFDDDGKMKEDETPIVENLKLNNDSYDQIKRWSEGLATAG